MQTPQGSERVAAPKRSGRKRLKKIRVAPASNGGFVVTHHYHPEHGGTPAPEVHVFADYAQTHGHLGTHMKAHR